MCLKFPIYLHKDSPDNSEKESHYVVLDYRCHSIESNWDNVRTALSKRLSQNKTINVIIQPSEMIADLLSFLRKSKKEKPKPITVEAKVLVKYLADGELHKQEIEMFEKLREEGKIPIQRIANY